MTVSITITDWYGRDFAMCDPDTGKQFGPVFDRRETAEEFLRLLGDCDPRLIPIMELSRLEREWKR